MQPHAVRVVAELGVGIGEEARRAAGVERPPVAAAVDRLEHAAGRQPEVHVRGVARVDDDRVEHRAVGRVLLGPLGPRLPHRMVVPAVDGRPRVAAVVAAEQALRRSAGVPDAGLVGVARREPEHRPRAPAQSLAAAERRRRVASVQVAPRSSDRNTVGPRWPVRMAAQHAAVAGIEHHVLGDVAEEGRLARVQGIGGVAREDEGALAGPHQQRHRR